MNERIQELRKQACQWVVANHQPADPKNYTQPEIDQRYLMYEEKFAQLIVEECGRVLEDNELGGYRVHYVLREHFSVDKD